MNKLIIGVILAVVVIGGLVVLNTQEETAPAPAAKATIAIVQSQVSVKAPGSSAFTVLTGDADIVAGTEVKTSSTGRARIVYPNGTITVLDGDSHIRVETLDESGDQSRIELVSGSIWSKIKNILGADEYYEVQTENVVASVRGTIFSTEFRNRVSKVYGIESKVKVEARDPVKKQVIEGTGVEVVSGEKVSVSSDQLPAPQKTLTKQSFADDDFRRPTVKKHIEEELEEEDVKKDREREFIRKVKDRNLDDREFLKKLIEKKLIEASEVPALQITASPAPTKTTTSTPTATKTSTPTPTPDTRPILESISPKSSTPGQKVALNGKNFTTGRNVAQINGVSVGKSRADFSIIDSLTIFVTVPPDAVSGTHDVSATTTAGETLSLPAALTISVPGY